MLRASTLLLLMILGPSCSDGSAGPMAGEPHVPCSSLFPVRHSEAAIMAMTFQEARQTLANAQVIKAVCGK